MSTPTIIGHIELPNEPMMHKLIKTKYKTFKS